MNELNEYINIKSMTQRETRNKDVVKSWRLKSLPGSGRQVLIARIWWPVSDSQVLVARTWYGGPSSQDQVSRI